mmetsp:Transcript_40920/g.98685  ORF Transcript_40920/g.98685 Transcript_40920/m.98685 type:complete len:1679 (-) Transcript_40920:120-5156(-)
MSIPTTSEAEEPSSSCHLNSAQTATSKPEMAESPLVKACSHLLKTNGSIIGDEVAEAILPLFPDLCSALPCHQEVFAERQALLGIDSSKRCLHHKRIREFIADELGPQLHKMGLGKGDRIALVLPNGPELALAIFGIAQWASCLPLNANGAQSELKKDLKLANASVVVGIEGETSIQELAASLDIPFCGLKPSTTETAIFQLIPSCAIKTPTQEELATRFAPNSHDDEVLVLFTSGTTGNKKLVPHKLGDMLIAAGCIAVSWNLTPTDVNCNLMPLFHVGGIVRQVFAPILSAGSVICCPSFDPQLFWQLLLGNDTFFSWYYAAPTMHQVLLQTMPSDAKPKLRMIANAAGGLLPSLAQKMRNTYRGANVLPSYGMTECMPISSPPYNYELTKPGTSGVAVGPEVCIFNANEDALEPGKEGSICVRGRPCFHGYGGQAKSKSFAKGGWFNTGDLGYLDEDGYLYITGRSKEVINRGGEIISPMEVEEEVLSHPSVVACAAFSASHDVLQEVVGIVIVPKPDEPKIDLPTLHDYLQTRLATAKWPHVMVFMDALPKSHTNKLLRVKLGQRLGLPEMNDKMLPVQRTFEADCPKQGTPVGTPIASKEVTVDAQHVQNSLHQALFINEKQLLVKNHPNRHGSLVVHATNDLTSKAIIEAGKKSLDAYVRPSHVCIYDEGKLTSPRAPQATDAVGFIEMMENAGDAISDPMIEELQKIMQGLISLDYLPPPDSSFFQVGGTSLLASQMASRIRKECQVPFSGADVFRYNNCIAMAKKIKSIQSASASTDGSSTAQYSVQLDDISLDSERLYPENSVATMVYQLLPGCVVFPLWYFTRFFLFFMTLLEVLNRVPGSRNMSRFIGTLVGYHFLWNVLSPLVFVMIKWIVIGEYKPGKHAFWSSYYIRWWFVDTCRKMFGKGFWGSSQILLITFYRLLGAKVAWDARISIEADIAEYDLVTIGKDASIEYCTLRGFGVDNGAMQLGTVEVGNSASVGIRSIVAPNTRVPDGEHVAPGTSSYEIAKDSRKHLAYNRYALPEPNLLWQLLVGSPITFLVDSFSHLPAMFVLYEMMIAHSSQWEEEHYRFETIGDLLEWLCDPERIPYYLGIRIVRATVAPFLYMVGALFVKWAIIGEFKEGHRDSSSQWDRMRHSLVSTLFSRENIQNVTDLLGRHYELTSIFYRLLGAKVGKRVFWPGHQPIFAGEFDLLEIGDDVVFGSRSVVYTTTTHSCEKVVFCAGANISDNTIVLPGSIIGKNAVLGSNTTCPAGRYLAPETTWVGSRAGEPILLDATGDDGDDGVLYSANVKPSDLEMVGDETTLRPFGRAVYGGKANYLVLPGWSMALISIAYEAMTTCFHALPLLGATFLTAGIVYGWPVEDRDYDEYLHSLIVSHIIFSIFTALHIARIVVGLVIEIAAKWFFMGRRKEGRYNWDECGYNQNWELYQLLARVRKLHRISTLDFLAGTPLMVEYFRALGSSIGNGCCLYPAGGDPYMPEPDLVTMGDNVCIDMASVVCHLNTRGNFELVPIVLQSNTTLRSRSRAQQGVVVEEGAMLLEKSLALTGEVMERESIWQGAPASQILLPKSHPRKSIEKSRKRENGWVLTNRRLFEIVFLSLALTAAVTLLPTPINQYLTGNVLNWQQHPRGNQAKWYRAVKQELRTNKPKKKKKKRKRSKKKSQAGGDGL